MATVYTILALVFMGAFVYGDSTQDLLNRYENTLQQVVNENSELQEKLDQMQHELKKQEKQKANMLANVLDLEHIVQIQKSDITALERTSLCINKPTSVEEILKYNRKRQVNAAWVGFTAVISPADVTGLGPHQPIIFDKVITNMADAYNATDGVFTSPTKGIYGFNMDILVEAGENEYLQFVKDGSHVMYNFAHASGSLHDASSSRTVILELEKGNQVWVQTSPNSHHGSGTIHGNGFSTFSGWLVAFVEDQTPIVG